MKIKIKLFGTVGCPNCVANDEIFKKNFKDYEKINVISNRDAIINYNIKCAPTVIIFDENNNELERFEKIRFTDKEIKDLKFKYEVED